MTDNARDNAITLAHPLPPSVSATNTSAEEALACNLAGDTTPCRPVLATTKMTVRKATAKTADSPGLGRRPRTSSLTYTVASQPVNMNTAMSRPAARSPCPPIPVRLNQPPDTGTVP